MQISRKAGAAIVAGAIGLVGLGALGGRYGPSLVDRLVQRPRSHQAQVPEKPDPRVLEQATERYDSANLQGKKGRQQQYSFHNILHRD